MYFYRIDIGTILYIIKIIKYKQDQKIMQMTTTNLVLLTHINLVT